MAPTTNNTNAKATGQKSLTSFFGAAKSKKTGEVIPPRKVQTDIKSALKTQTKQQQQQEQSEPSETQAPAVASKDKSDSHVEKKKESVVANEKENVTNDDDDIADVGGGRGNDDLMDTDDDNEDAPETETIAKKKRASTAAKKTATSTATGKTGRKRVIDDESEDEAAGNDDDDDEASDDELDEDYNGDNHDNEDDEINEEDEDDNLDLSDDDADNNDDDIGKEAPKASGGNKSTSSPKLSTAPATKQIKKQKTLPAAAATASTSTNDDVVSSPSPTKATAKTSLKSKSSSTTTSSNTNNNSGATKKSEAVAKAMKSNSQLLAIMKEEVDSNDTSRKIWNIFSSLPSDKQKQQQKQPSTSTTATATTTPYSALCDVFTEIENVSGRLEIQEKLTTLFRKVLLKDGGGDGGGLDDEKKATSTASAASSKADNPTQSDLYTLLYLASNTVAPQHANVELGVGDGILIKAIGEASGTAPNMIKKKYEKEGDLGNVAMNAKGKQRTLVGFGKATSGGPKRLSCVDVLKVFKEIANVTGSQSQKWKVDKIKSLLVRAKGCESKYIIRGLQGKLRIGLAKNTVLASLSHAVMLTKPRGVVDLTEEELARIRKLDGTDEAYPPTARSLCEKRLPPLDVQLEAAVDIVKKAYNEVSSYDALLDALLSAPIQELHQHCALLPGVPVGPMLAKPTKSVQEVLKRLDGLRFTCEYKYDGERAQVHMLSNGETKVFSRSLLNTSEKFPEVPLYVQESCKETKVVDFVLDAEVVAFNRETKQFVPFQVLSTRKRTEESAESAKVQVIVQAFDLMYLNGKSLLDKTLAERRDLMKKNFLPIEGKFQYATSIDHTEDGDTAVIEEFLDAAVKGQCEGLMVKTLDVNAAYEPSRRSLNWLKLKKDYLEGLGDSVDLVPLGAYHGKGKRTGVYGAYLLACYDEDTEQFQSVCKIGTGFSDEDLKELTASLNNHTIPEKSSQYNVSDTLACDVWFDAVQVWEVKAADLSKSSTHKGAIDKTGENGRGIGLRFPRFERIRTDKKPEDATSSDQILDMYYAQDSIVAGGDGGDDMDGI
ncbi:hypothetical protein ACHAWU_000840 [Discostella pseudostelligera]|uniref:DNA ligase n=1 Tax=Discostella pseudostelligera TaxID=259834 RepID=A0ABD3M688_9STRA